MSQAFKNIAILGNPLDAAALETVTTLVDDLLTRNVSIVVSSKLPQPASPARHATVDDADLPEGADLVMAVGGDGTMLYAARHASAHGIPVLGINRGRLGFLADIKPEEIAESLDAVLGGNFVRESRMLLHAQIMRDGVAVSAGFAVNDVVIKRRETARMLDYRTVVDGHFVNTHGGGGFIAATPTGATP